jgi:hypothetical protein
VRVARVLLACCIEVRLLLKKTEPVGQAYSNVVELPRQSAAGTITKNQTLRSPAAKVHRRISLRIHRASRSRFNNATEGADGVAGRAVGAAPCSSGTGQRPMTRG